MREQIEKELSFRLELIRDEQGLDQLSTNTSNLPAIGELYSIYFCWLDEPAALGAQKIEKRKVVSGSMRGTGRHPETESGYSSTSVGTSSSGYWLRDRNRGGDQGLHYESGRVCTLAVSSKGIYVSNVVTVPEKLEKAVEPHAEELRAGERKADAVPSKTNADDGR